VTVLGVKLGLPWPRSRSAPIGPAAHLFSLRRMTSLTLGLLAVTVAIALYGLCSVVGDAPLRIQVITWSAAGMLATLASLVLLLGRFTTARLLRHVEAQLRHLTRSDEIDPIQGRVPAELQRVLIALGDYLAHVQHRLNNLRVQKKELDIQMRMADAERRHTEAIIFSISDAVLVVDSFGELVLANTAAERLFGFRLTEWRHRPIERVVNDAALAGLLRETRSAGPHAVRRQVEYSALRAGQAQTYNITLSTVLDSQGQPRGVVAVFHDITHEREIARMKTDFVSAVSHELKTPLSSMKAYIEMLVDGEAPDEQTRNDFYRIIASETDRLQRLITKILDISRIEAGVMEVRMASIQLNAVVQEVYQVMLPQAAARDIDLACELADDLPALWADRDLVDQAVLNVASNAVKYTPPGGHVRIRTSADPGGRHLDVTVSDDGIGVRAEDLSRIFDKFFRARDTEHMAKGCGLGLNLVKHIVETVHHGEIAVTSEHGAGTTMVLRFPLARGRQVRDLE
jgi:two-component system phosphate regulon sensor histidine kinase PhoR